MYSQNRKKPTAIRKVRAGWQKIKSRKPKILSLSAGNPIPHVKLDEESRMAPPRSSSAHAMDMDVRTLPDPTASVERLCRPELAEPALDQQQNEMSQPAGEIPVQSEQAHPLVAPNPSPNDEPRKSLELSSLPVADTQASLKSLWDEAYETLRTRHSKLVVWYETILSQYLKKSITTPPLRIPRDTFANLIDQQDWKLRRVQMKNLLDIPIQNEEAAVGNDGPPIVNIIKDMASITPSSAVLAWVAARYAASKV